jgi:hypothetical protein
MANALHAATAALAATLVLSCAAAWANEPAPRAAAVQAVVDCRKIDDSAQRLACYDKAADAISAAEDKGDLVSLDRTQRQTMRRQAFGLALPSFGFLDRGEKSDEANRIVETVASARQDAYGKWTIIMQDGEIWRQIDEEELTRRPHAGSSAVIKRAALGSFMMDVDGQPAIRVHRDN